MESLLNQKPVSVLRGSEAPFSFLKHNQNGLFFYICILLPSVLLKSPSASEMRKLKPPVEILTAKACGKLNEVWIIPIHV